MYEVGSRLKAASLRIASRYARSPVTSRGGPVVSLTTYGNRIQSVHLAIESIARGQMRPSRLILWLDDELLIENLPIGIRRLQSRGLEVKLSKNYGPHTKYYPYLESLKAVEELLVTADDDILYPSNWLMGLAKAFEQFPDFVNCYWARAMILNLDGMGKYESWGFTGSTKPSFCNFAIGSAGVIYPIPLQRALKQEGTEFMKCCPKADDLWLHVQALRAGYKVRQIGVRPLPLAPIPGTKSTALSRENVSRGGNDRQIKATYRASDLGRLRECG